ncbi:PREDICTED: MAGE-like protein 2 [Ceratosolen solmsi marchali]|uniref:MAGE-like protein 2 n=1 Tax=Ceratosolen solmsi marchali TaxID=326594 RepID=A0AAJ6YY72_9HYME|nr:PREDICTED: MAGE-like protein 2 [Ceratosolen solmsi marchali]
MSQRIQKSRKCLSQPTTSSNTSQSSQNDEDHRSNTQISHDQSLSSQEHAHHVGNVVKYILAADHSKIPIVRSAISKAVNCQGKNFRAVMNSAQEVLRDVFGYKLVDVESGKFILCNTIKNDLPHLNFDENVKNRYVLLFLVLTHIYMSGEVCTEGSLFDFLTKLEIISDGNMINETFGNVLELITIQFVREKYIKLEKSDNDDESELKWGIRAHEELSVRSVMEFVSKVYDNRDIKTWPQQYEGMLQKERMIAEEEN